MTSQRHRGAYTFRSVQLFLSKTDLEIWPSPGHLGTLRSLRIPAASVSGCSLTCFGGADRHGDLVLEAQGAQLSFDAASEIVEWCWRNGLPMLTGAEERAWMYGKQPLSSKARYVPVPRDEYERQANRTCMGY